MSCKSTDELVIYVDGVHLSRPRNDNGCNGESHYFTLTTTLSGNLSYRWALDKLTNVVSTKPYYTYTFDTKVHKLYVTVESQNCGIQETVSLVGKICSNCSVECVSQTADIPAGDLVNLIDENGKIYKIDAGMSLKCRASSNVEAAKAVKRAIRMNDKCSAGNLSTSIYFNQSGKYCLTLTINNSHVKFKTVTVGTSVCAFDKSQC